MIDISLTDFVDFTIKSGPAQYTKVKEVFARGEYDPRTDFWKPLRDCIREFHKGKRALESVLIGLSDSKKATRYPQAVTGYTRFLKKNKPNVFTVPSWKWTYGDLSVKVNPEVGFELADKKFAVKLYFKDEALTNLRLRIVFALMAEVIPAGLGLVPAVLDVSSAKLRVGRPSDANLRPVLEAQANSFVHMWRSLEKKAIATAS
jgi:hypothetical protein